MQGRIQMRVLLKNARNWERGRSQSMPFKVIKKQNSTEDISTLWWQQAQSHCWGNRPHLSASVLHACHPWTWRGEDTLRVPHVAALNHAKSRSWAQSRGCIVCIHCLISTCTAGVRGQVRASFRSRDWAVCHYGENIAADLKTCDLGLQLQRLYSKYSCF